MEVEAKKLAVRVVEWAAILGILATAGSYWINTEVERRMNELVIDPSAAPAVVANTTRLETLSEGQARIEGKVDAFSTKFLEYLERQAQ